MKLDPPQSGQIYPVVGFQQTWPLGSIIDLLLLLRQWISATYSCIRVAMCHSVLSCCSVTQQINDDNNDFEHDDSKRFEIQVPITA